LFLVLLGIAFPSLLPWGALVLRPASPLRGAEAVVALFFISVLGTIIPYVASSIQIWVSHQLELGLFLRQSAVAWLLLNVVMLLLMAVTSIVAFLSTLPFRNAIRDAAGS